VVSVVLFFCALLSKTVTCSLPAVILLLLWWKRDRLGGRDILPLIPMFIVGASMALITTSVEKAHVGAHGTPWILSFTERCLIAGGALCFSASKLIWPMKLAFLYPRWSIDTHAWWQYLYPAVAVAAPAALWLARKRLGKGPLVAVLIYTGTLFPALGFFN